MRSINKSLEKSFNSLTETKKETESKVMFNGDDPTDDVCKELRLQYERAERDYDKFKAESQKGGFFRLARLPLKSNNSDRLLLEARINQTEDGYKKSSSLRYSFEDASKLAFMKEPFVSITYQHESWNVNFQQIQLSDASVWKALEFAEDDFNAWWKSRQNVAKLPGTQEWEDVKALSGGIVLLLEYCYSAELSGSFLDIYIKAITQSMKKIMQKILPLMNYPEHFSSISELLGYAAPIIFVSQKWLKTLRDKFNEERRTFGDVKVIAKFYERQVVYLECLVKALLAKIEALADGTVISLQNLRLEHRASERESMAMILPHIFNDRESKGAAQALEMLPLFTEKSLQKLGLRKIQFNSFRGKDIGYGSFSVVFERTTSDGAHRYAVKVPTGADRDTLWNRVGREAQIWRLLDHENILPLRGYCIDSDNIPALVMDRCLCNLKQYNQHYPEAGQKKKLDLLRGVAKGLVHIHSKSIAHGDLRASNILVKESKTGDILSHTPMIIDFGISYFVDGKSDPLLSSTTFETTLGQCGNPNWLSPELLRKSASETRGCDPTCISIPGDIYSLGCVFLEVLFNRDPFQSCSSEEEKKVMKLEGHPPATLEDTNPIYYPFLQTLWDPIPDNRPSAKTIVKNIEAFLRSSD